MGLYTWRTGTSITPGCKRREVHW